MSQIELHKKIDDLIKLPPSEMVSNLIVVNDDAKIYFYSQVTEDWLDWLWEQGFLNSIKSTPADKTKYSYQMPELEYLVRMAEKLPEKVTDIILEVNSSADSFNPEVIDRFLWIASILSAEQIARLVPKIEQENWVKLMADFRHWGFEYEKILGRLLEAKDYENLLKLSEVVLSVRDIDEKKVANGYRSDNPFYFSELPYTKVFEYLEQIPQEYYEKALALTISVLAKIVLLSEPTDGDDIFEIRDAFHFYDLNFFTLEPNQKDYVSYHDDVQELAAAIKVFLTGLIKQYCEQNSAEARRIYEQYIATLPDSREMYRLKLYTVSLCHDEFKKEIKDFLFNIFKYENPWNLISGAEYEELIISSFSILTEEERIEYISKVIALFGKEDGDKPAGKDLLSAAYKFLTEEEKQIATEKFGSLTENYKPMASMSQMYAGTVIPQAPDDPVWDGPVAEIVEKLKTDWSPDNITKIYPEKDYLHPTDADGVSDRLKSEMVKRTQDYLDNAELFFDRDILDSHYTYTYLRGIENLSRDKKLTTDHDLSKVLLFIENICESGTGSAFENEKNKKGGLRWLANWGAVHKAISDVIRQLLTGQPEGLLIDFIAQRNNLLKIIGYLLEHPDPTTEEENVETAKSKVKAAGNDEYEANDPFTTAINSVRGRAFESLISFIFHDGKRLAAAGVKIAEDVKALYEQTLDKEDTQSLMFMFGHYLPSLYFRDMEWIYGLLSKIFSLEAEDKDLYLAAWEGYLANNLYQEMFNDEKFIELYERAIALSSDEYTKRRYFRNLDEGVANHLALAFMYYDDFSFDSSLFKLFWSTQNKERHSHFISFLGRAFVSGDNAQANILLKENETARKKLVDFWDWVLEQPIDPGSLTEFGYWLKKKKQLFDMQWLASHVRITIEKTGGNIDWGYGLMTSINDLAKSAPEDTLQILRLMILQGGIKGNKQNYIASYTNDEWLEAFRILYNTPETKDGTYKLVDDLIREGGRTFWKFKDVLK